MASPPPSPATDVAEALRRQLGAAHMAFSAEEQARHAALLASVIAPGDVALDARPDGDDRWTLTVCTADATGVLSIIAGLLTAEQLDIETADVFSVRLPTPPAPARPRRRRSGRGAANGTVSRVLDIFRLRPLGDVTPATWERLRADLATLVEQLAGGQGDLARDHVVERVSEVLRSHPGSRERLWPVTIETANDTPNGATALRIRGQDSPGFLFELANALALLRVNIVTAEVRTIDGETHDTFVISDARGAPVQDPARLAQIRAAAALIKQFTAQLPLAPDPALALRQFGALTGQLLMRENWASELTNLGESEVLQTLANVMGASVFLWEDFLRMQHANLFPILGDVTALGERTDTEALRARLSMRLAESTEGETQPVALNAFKDREMFRIDLRHITGHSDFRTFSDELTSLAEVVVGGAAVQAESEATRRFGRARLNDGAPCAWAACALGKCGGRELGFASDIELLFVYEADELTDGSAPVPNAHYFQEWVRAFLRTLVTRHDGIFEVDLRLRPYGNAGALASTEAGVAAYYAAGGPARQFERMALVKLRAVAGDPALGARIERLRDAFVYSDVPLDIAEVRHLRARQAIELVPSGAISAKYSAGGAVDVEYWTQAHQIVAGAHDVRVRVTNTLDVLEQLSAGGHIDAALAEEVRLTYAFQRRLIDALRVVRGHARDLTIPPPESREFAYLARRLESDRPATLSTLIRERMAFASSLWERGPR